MTIKTLDIMGPGKNAKDPFVIPKEEEPVHDSTKRMNSQNEIKKTCLNDSEGEEVLS